MTTEKQIQANRLNALKGGVKTEEGKAAVRLNAVSHGFFCKEVLLPGDDAALMDDLRSRYMSELQPVGELETMLVEWIISNNWRLKRLLGSEITQTRIHSDDTENEAGFTASVNYRNPALQNVLRYETAIERQIYKAMHELESLQQARLQKSAPLSPLDAASRFLDSVAQNKPSSNFYSSASPEKT